MIFTFFMTFIPPPANRLFRPSVLKGLPLISSRCTTGLGLTGVEVDDEPLDEDRACDDWCWSGCRRGLDGNVGTGSGDDSGRN